jgi:hypothetical protein
MFRLKGEANHISNYQNIQKDILPQTLKRLSIPHQQNIILDFQTDQQNMYQIISMLAIWKVHKASNIIQTQQQ